MIARHRGQKARGDPLRIGDCNVVPQFYSAQSFDVDVSEFRHVEQAVGQVMEAPAVAAAHSDLQPGANEA